MARYCAIVSSPEVSVLLATYKANPEWLRKAIDSVRAQTFTDFELLVLDDDHSAAVRKMVSLYRDRRIRYLPGPGKGPGANHAYGICQATAPLLSILNHDDAWEPTMLQTLLGAYRSVPDVVLAFSDHFVMNEAGEIDPARSDELSLQWKRTSLAPGIHQPFYRIALLDGSVALAQSAVFSWAAVTDLDPRSGQVYDRYLTYLLARTGRPAIYVPERLSAWRESQSNLTSKRSLEGSIEHWRLSWRLLIDPALADLRGPMVKGLARSTLGVIGSVWYVAKQKSCWP